RWTYGTDCSGVPLGPTVPTTAPSLTAAPLATPIEPRCVSVTEYPSAVSIVRLSPLVGTKPAKLTVPFAGATTVSPGALAPMSMPRCWPASYGCASSYENGCSTRPCTGQLHALATGTQTRNTTTTVVNLSNTEAHNSRLPTSLSNLITTTACRG